MNKLIMLLSAGLATLLFTACGSSGSSSDPVDEMSTRDAIIISHGVPVGDCADPDIQQYIISEGQATGATDFLFRAESSSVTCATYNKVDGITETEGCIALYFNEGTETCVIGFNVPTSTANAISEIGTLIEVY